MTRSEPELDEPSELQPLKPIGDWQEPLGLPPEMVQRVKALYDRGVVWHVAYNSHVRSLRFGMPAFKGLTLQSLFESIRRINDELDTIVPPNAEELALRAKEDEARDRRFAMQRQLGPIIAAHRKIEALAKWLLNDISVDRRYEQVARSATDFAARRLAPHRKPPRIQFFHPDGKALGRFKPAQPDTIHIADGLSDEDLVIVCNHETSHWATPPDGGSETIAKHDEGWLSREYFDTHGRRTHRGWEAVA